MKEKFAVGCHDANPNDLEPHPANPAIYGENEDVSDLVELIGEFGIQRRLIVNIYGEIISGNRRKRAALILDLETVPIEVRAFKSREEEEQLLLSENATRTKTVFQKVREGQKWQEVESKLAQARRRATQKNKSSVELEADQEIFPELGSKGQSRDIIAKRVGLGSGKTYQKALKVVLEIDRLSESGQIEQVKALKHVLNNGSIEAAHKLLKLPDANREKLLEIISSDKGMTVKEAQKLLKQLNPTVSDSITKQASQTSEDSSQSSQQEFSSVEDELDAKQKELGLPSSSDSVLPESDRLDELQHQNPTDIDDRDFISATVQEINPNAVVSSFINTLDYLGAEQIKTINRAVAKRKKAAVKDAAAGLADSEDEAIEIIKTISQKYPNAIKQAMENL